MGQNSSFVLAVLDNVASVGGESNAVNDFISCVSIIQVLNINTLQVLTISKVQVQLRAACGTVLTAILVELRVGCSGIRVKVNFSRGALKIR